MRVYNHGTLWTDIKDTCAACQCEFIFRLKDVRDRIEYSFTTGKGRAYRYVVCPECGVKNVFEDPIDHIKYYDLIEKSEDQPIPTDVIYDGGDEDTQDTIIYDSGDDLI